MSTLPADKKAKIKKALLAGGVVVAPRGSGKSMALAEIMAADPNVVAITHVNAQNSRLVALLDKLNILPYGRVFGIASVKHSDIAGKTVYLDEVPLDKTDGIPFKGAVLSVPFTITVIK